MNNLTLKQKILQMFILGFEGLKPDNLFNLLVKNGLGGVIFFTRNIESKEQFTDLIKEISNNAPIPLFFSIDQEGGRVERTENIHNGKKYLSAKYAFEKGEKYLRKQSKELAQELKNYGINMNFAPVLDVNTNENNPIIGERAFSNNADEVVEGGKIVFEEFKKQKLIAVAKHFPGHGASDKDSHKTLPLIDLPKSELMNVHIKPFIEAIKSKCPAIMAAHVLYPALDNTNTPASVSKIIINNLLINQLGFKGLVITDDMEMNGIKNFSKIEACTKAINAGVNMFIFRDCTQEIFDLIEQIEQKVIDKEINIEKIDNSIKKITEIKISYGIIK